MLVFSRMAPITLLSLLTPASRTLFQAVASAPLMRRCISSWSPWTFCAARGAAERVRDHAAAGVLAQPTGRRAQTMERAATEMARAFDHAAGRVTRALDGSTRQVPGALDHPGSDAGQLLDLVGDVLGLVGDRVPEAGEVGRVLLVHLHVVEARERQLA